MWINWELTQEGEVCDPVVISLTKIYLIKNVLPEGFYSHTFPYTMTQCSPHIITLNASGMISLNLAELFKTTPATNGSGASTSRFLCLVIWAPLFQQSGVVGKALGPPFTASVFGKPSCSNCSALTGMHGAEVIALLAGVHEGTNRSPLFAHQLACQLAEGGGGAIRCSKCLHSWLISW